jgi:hypothetical protein
VTSRLRLLTVLAGLAFFIAHVRTLPATLEDIDSINFALGVEHFDVAAHRPHPPGYPVLIALAKISTPVLQLVRPSWDRDRTAAVGLAIWGVVAGTLATWILTEFWLALGLSSPLAFFAALLCVVSPPFWFSAARPLSDVPGLVAAMAVLAPLVGDLGMRRDGGRTSLSGLVWAAVGAGFIIGLRSQTVWMTAPVLAWCVGRRLLARQFADAGKLVGAAAIGVLLWAVPLVATNGGPAHYWAAVTSQGAQDLSNIELLATTPTTSLLRLALNRTLIDPWQSALLGKVVLGLAILGILRLLWRGPRLLSAVAGVFVPYLVFHLLFQETVTLRYALPLVVPLTGLAVTALAGLGVGVAALATAAAAIGSLLVVQPPLQDYARHGAPVFRAFQDMQRALPATPDAPVLRMHHQVWWGVLRVTEWYRPYWDTGLLPFPRDREWLSVVDHWNADNRRPVWFLSELTRNDLALFDVRSRTLRGRYETPADIRGFLSSFRLDGLSWWSLERPAWMLGTGWSLTPEIAGMTNADGLGPHVRPAEGFLLRQSSPLRMMIGGRYLAAAGGPAARLSVDLDGAPIAEWIVPPEPRWFVQWIDLPGGLPPSSSPYGRLTVRAQSAEAGKPAPIVGLEQFDAAPPDDLEYALADGWHEYEENARTGQVWRWTSDRSTVLVRGDARDLVLSLAGESPLKNFDRPPTVIVRAGARELSRFQPAADFTQTIDLPADALRAASGRVTIETSRTFVPGKGPGADQRTLGLKLFRVEIKKR